MTKITAIKLGSVGVAMAGLFVTASLLAAQADAPPLAVTCSGVPSDNTIAWTASPTGGNSPYSYLWGGAEIAGGTSSTVTGTYDASGTYTADIQVTDASSTVATSTCSAIITMGASSSTPTSTPSADISITKTVDNMNPATSTNVNYMIMVSAMGPDTSTDVMATDLLPGGLTFENATPSIGSYASSTGDWTIGDMSPSSTATLGIEAMINAGTEGEVITNTADVTESSTEADPNPDNNSASASLTVMSAPTSTPTSTMPEANLSIMKTVDNASPASDTMVNYTLTVSALGPATSTAAMATDILPTGLTFENATASEGTYTSSTGAWTIGDMSPSSTATLMIGALVNPGTQGDVITNSATVGESSSVMNMSGNTSSAATLTVQPAATSTSGGTPTSTPLNVSCDFGFDASNVITWTSSVSGGTAPYTYSWSGTQVSGATSSTVTATYPTTGAYYATVNVTDADSNTGTATCSASVTSIPSGGGGGTTPTSTPPTIPPTLTIGPNGSFLGRGMIVTSVASGSFQAEIWGITYTVDWSGKLPHFFFRNGNTDTNWVPSAQVNVGDIVGVSGMVSPTNPLVVTADTVRDYSITSPRPGRGGFPFSSSSQNQSNSSNFENGFRNEFNFGGRGR